MENEGNVYMEVYKDVDFYVNNSTYIKFGDFISGKSKSGIEFQNLQFGNIGAGTLGVIHEESPIQFESEFVGIDDAISERIDKKSVSIIRKISNEERAKL